MSEEIAREPNEMAEDFEKAHHDSHGGHEEHPKPVKKSRSPAIIMAVLCVLTAIANQFSGHAETEAVMLQNEAKSTWNYYQSISTKQHVFESTDLIMDALATSGVASEKIDTAKARIADAQKKYEKQKEEKLHEAQALENQSKHELVVHRNYSTAVGMFQIGMVLVTVALVMSAPVWAVGGIAFGAVGLFFCAVGYFGPFWEILLGAAGGH